MSTASSSVVSDQFPAGLRVLVVDDDPICLTILEKMLRTCLYEVTKCNRAESALSLLRGNKNGYDIVISDVHMPDMDGFKLLEQVGLEIDVPVILMSADDNKNVVMKGVTHGACDYLIKPVRIEALRNIWQHVLRKRMNDWKDFDQSGSAEEGDRRSKPSEEPYYSSSVNEGNWRNSKRRKEGEEEAEERHDTSTLKKPSVVWSVELHRQFVAAVDQLGIDKAVPGKILELMNVPGLTRENVVSHLQKYRLYLRKVSGVSRHQSNSFISPQEASYGPLSATNGLDLQTLAAAGQIPAQSLATLQAAGLGRSTTKSGIPMSLVDQRNLSSFDNPKLSGAGKQMNLQQGIPTTVEAKHLVNWHHSAHSLGALNMQVDARGGQSGQSGQSSYLILQIAHPQSRAQILNETTGGQVAGLQTSIVQPALSNGIAGVVLTRNGIGENGRVTGGYNPVSQTSSMLNSPRSRAPELPATSFPHEKKNLGTILVFTLILGFVLLMYAKATVYDLLAGYSTAVPKFFF